MIGLREVAMLDTEPQLCINSSFIIKNAIRGTYRTTFVDRPIEGLDGFGGRATTT